MYYMSRKFSIENARYIYVHIVLSDQVQGSVCNWRYWGKSTVTHWVTVTSVSQVSHSSGRANVSIVGIIWLNEFDRK